MICHRSGIRHLLVQAQGQRFDASGDQPTVERGGHQPQCFLGKHHLLVPAGLIGANRTTEGIGMAIDIFRGAGEGQGGAEFQRTLHQGGREGVVDHDGDAGGAGSAADRIEVNHLEQWIGGTLQPDHRWLPLNDAGCRLGVGEIHPFGAHPKLGKHLFEQAHGAAVEVLFADHQISLAQGGGNRGDRTDS